MAVERWNIQKKQHELENALMDHYERQLAACKSSEHNLNKKAETLYNKIFMEIKWSYPPIAGVHANLILEYCRHLITKGSYLPFPKEMDLRSWNVKVKGTLQEKSVGRVKDFYNRLFRLISRRDMMITAANNTLMLTSEKMKIKNEGTMRWMMEQNHGKKDEYFSLWNLARINRLRELQVLFSSANKMKEYEPDGVNCVDPDFCLTALHYACKESHFDIVQFLLQQGADVKIAGPDGRTPLHFAAAYSNREIVLALLGAGSIATAVDNNGNTPLDLARQNQNHKTLPTLQHWEDLMGFKGDADDEAMLMSLEASANLHDASQGLQDAARSTLLQVDSVDKLPDATRSFIMDGPICTSDESMAFAPVSDYSRMMTDLPSHVPWEYATIAAADYQKMSRDLQFLVQRLNGFNPYLIMRQKQLYEQQHQVWQSQRLNPNYQQQLYMSQTNWPAVTSNMMQTAAFAWNSSMTSVPYNPSLHAASQSILAANFAPDLTKTSPSVFAMGASVDDVSSAVVNDDDLTSLASVQMRMQPQERILLSNHPNRVSRPPALPEDDEQRRINQELKALGVSFAGDTALPNQMATHVQPYDPMEVKYKYLTEIRLCTKYFVACTKEELVGEAVRVLHRRWTVAKKLYDAVARRMAPVNPRAPSQTATSEAANEPTTSMPPGKRLSVVVDEDQSNNQAPASSSSLNQEKAAVAGDEAHETGSLGSAGGDDVVGAMTSPTGGGRRSPKMWRGKTTRFEDAMDDDAASAVSAMTADFDLDDERVFASPMRQQSTTAASNSVDHNQSQEQPPVVVYDGARPAANLEKLASDFLRTFTIIEYLPATPGESASDKADDASSAIASDQLPPVRRISQKIFVEGGDPPVGSTSSPSRSTGLVVDSHHAKTLDPKNIIQKLLQRYANEEHRVRLMEYAWRYENQELLDHYTVYSSTAAASQSLSTAISADRRYRDRLAQRYPHGTVGYAGLGGGLGLQPPPPLPHIAQVAAPSMQMGSGVVDGSGTNQTLAAGGGLGSPSRFGAGGGSVISHLTAPSLSVGRGPLSPHLTTSGFLTASQIAQSRRDHTAGNVTGGVIDGGPTGLMGPDENSTIVSLTSWDLSIQRHYQQHPPPIYSADNQYMTPIFPLTDLEKYAENYVLLLGMEFVEVLLVQREYDQALLCLEDCLRLHDGVLITMRIRVIFQLCDLILYLCDSCWDVDEEERERLRGDGATKNPTSTSSSPKDDRRQLHGRRGHNLEDDDDEDVEEDDGNEANNGDGGEHRQMNEDRRDNGVGENQSRQPLPSHQRKPPRQATGEAAFSPYASLASPSVISQKKSSGWSKSLVLPAISASTSSSTTSSTSAPSTAVGSLAKAKSAPSLSHRPRRAQMTSTSKETSSSSTVPSSPSTNTRSKEEQLAEKWFESIMGTPSSHATPASGSKKKPKKTSKAAIVRHPQDFVTSFTATPANAASSPTSTPTTTNHRQHGLSHGKYTQATKTHDRSVKTIRLDRHSVALANASRLSTLPSINASVPHATIHGPSRRRRQGHVLETQADSWPTKLAAIEAQWDAIRRLPSLSVRDTLQANLQDPAAEATDGNEMGLHPDDASTGDIAYVHDRLYRKLLRRCWTIAQEAIDLGSVLSARHVFEPLFIAQAMGYVGLARERLGEVQEAWEMLEQASLVAARVAYAHPTTIELMLNSLRVFVKYQCRGEAQLTWVSKKAAEINAMIAQYAPTTTDAQADRWWRQSAEWLAIATMTVRDPYVTVTGHATTHVNVQTKSLAETLQTTSRSIRYL